MIKSKKMTSVKQMIIVLSPRARNLLLPNKMIKEKIAAAMDVTLHTVQRWLNENDPLITQATALAVIREETGLEDDLLLTEIPVQK